MRNNKNSAGLNKCPDLGGAFWRLKHSQSQFSDRAPTKSRLPKREIIRKQDTFRAILESGKRWHEKHMILVYRSYSERRIGFAVSKRLGNAVVRNRMKRRMREIYRIFREKIDGMEVIMLAKNDLDRASFCDLQEEFARFIKNSGEAA